MENQYQIIYTENAQRELDRISDYYELTYKIIIRKINNDIKNLQFMPRAHKTLIFVKDPNGEYRRMISGKYIVIYKIEKNYILILHIFNHKQNYLNSQNFILKEESQPYFITHLI